MGITVLASRLGEVGVSAAVEAAQGGGTAIDAVEAGIRPVEDEPAIRSVGRGGWTNLVGEVELDASIMDGSGLRCGAVGALRGYPHAISVARQVMERLPHVLLVGDGAARFAAECGPEAGCEAAETATEESRAQWRSWLEKHVPRDVREEWPDVDLASWSRLTADPETAKGTTCFLVKDASGDIAAGVSTCGWAFKYPGRVGDSPLIGAGCYADNRYGAAACTGKGELAIRAGTARSVVTYMKQGLSVTEACDEAIVDLSALSRQYRGGLVIHAIDSHGAESVRAIGVSRRISYWLWREGMSEPRGMPVEVQEW